MYIYCIWVKIDGYCLCWSQWVNGRVVSVSEWVSVSESLWVKSSRFVSIIHLLLDFPHQFSDLLRLPMHHMPYTPGIARLFEWWIALLSRHWQLSAKSLWRKFRANPMRCYREPKLQRPPFSLPCCYRRRLISFHHKTGPVTFGPNRGNTILTLKNKTRTRVFVSNAGANIVPIGLIGNLGVVVWSTAILFSLRQRA